MTVGHEWCSAPRASAAQWAGLVFRSQNSLGAKPLVIGVLTDWVADPYQAAILRGVSQAATPAGATLLVFVGGTLSSKLTDTHNFIYDYARRGVLDGVLMLSSTLIHEVGVEGLQTYSQRFGDLPVVSVGAALSGIPSITVNNSVGVTSLIDHLVAEHGAKNIACIRGPKANAEAEARTMAYVEALQRHKLPFNERWIIEGNFTLQSGEAAIGQLARVPGFKLTDLDAIVANNDSMAIGAMTELAKRGIAVPDQVAVVGFDDLADAQLVQPPLASVAQPLTKLGVQAARSILERVQHGSPGSDEVLATEMVLRRSCGCADVFSPPRSSFIPPAERTVEVSTLMRRQRILLEIARAAKGGLGSAGSDWEQTLFNSFTQTVATPVLAGGAFMREFQVLAERVANANGDLKLLDQVLEVFRQQMVPLLRHDVERRERADDLFHLARGTLSLIQQRTLSRRQLSLDRWNNTLALVCNEISGAYSYPKLRAVLGRQLPSLGLHSCFIVAYEPDGSSDRATVVACFDSEVDCTAFENRVFRARDLIPLELAQLGKRPHSYTVLPLVWDGERIGHILVELDTDTLFISGALCGAVASALSGARLIEGASARSTSA